MKEIEAFRANVLPFYEKFLEEKKVVKTIVPNTKKEKRYKRERKKGQILTPKQICEKYKLSYYLFREFMCRTEVIDFIAEESNKGIPTLLYDNQHLALEIKMHFDRKKKNVK